MWTVLIVIGSVVVGGIVGAAAILLAFGRGFRW
jgi:hypothetical protein